jgi:ferric-dicitrate binding protein FerR (iron transport regulator)
MEKVIVKNAGGESAEIKENDLPEIAVVKVRYDSLAAVPTTRETQWMQDKLVFKQVKFGIIIKELEQYYNTRIIVRDSSLLNRRLSGVFQNETLAEVLETFKLAAGLKYKTEDSVVIIFK